MELPEFLIAIQEFIGGLVQKYGALGIGAAMLVESAGVPFVSTAVLVMAGGMILSGRADFWALLLSSTAGIILGSMISYIIGFLGGSLGRAVGNHVLNNRGSKEAAKKEGPSSSGKMHAFIEKYGTYSVFAGQLWGVTRTFISFPAGAMHMNLFVFIASTALGGAIFSLWIIGWSLIFTGAAGMIFRLLKIAASLSPWYLLPILLCTAALIYFYRKKRWKLPIASLMTRLKCKR